MSLAVGKNEFAAPFQERVRQLSAEALAVPFRESFKTPLDCVLGKLISIHRAVSRTRLLGKYGLCGVRGQEKWGAIGWWPK